MKRPTKKQFELLNYVTNFIKEHGYGPSYREIMMGLEYRSVATVAVHIQNLITNGYLAKRDRSARSLYVVDAGVEESSLATNYIKPADEKWLVKRVEQEIAEAEKTPTEQALNNIFVLIGALKVLGLEGAAQSFLPRLKRLKESFEGEV